MPPEPRRAASRRRYDPRAKVARLVEAAASVIGERGIAGATVPLITARAGVSRGLIHYHFPNLAALVREAARQHCAEWVRTLESVVAQAGDADALAREAVAVTRALVAQSPVFWSLRAALRAQAQHDPALAEIMSAGDRAAAQFIGPLDALLCGFAVRPEAQALEPQAWATVERGAVALARQWRDVAAA